MRTPRSLLHILSAAVLAFSLVVCGNVKAADAASAIRGRVVCLETGRPLAHAIVAFSESVIAGTQIPAGTTVAETADDGTFTLAHVAGSHLAVFARDGHAVLHKRVMLAESTTMVGDLALAMPTASERAWLVLVNADRAKYGSAPLQFDAAALVAARGYANAMAGNGQYSHSGKDGSTHVSRYEAAGGVPPRRLGENIDTLATDYAATPATWQAAEARFMAESKNCTSRAACQYVDDPTGVRTTGHFLNLTDPSYVWVGLGIAKGRNPANVASSQAQYAYFDQEFVAPQ